MICVPRSDSLSPTNLARPARSELVDRTCRIDGSANRPSSTFAATDLTSLSCGPQVCRVHDRRSVHDKRHHFRHLGLLIESVHPVTCRDSVIDKRYEHVDRARLRIPDRRYRDRGSIRKVEIRMSIWFNSTLEPIGNSFSWRKRPHAMWCIYSLTADDDEQGLQSRFDGQPSNFPTIAAYPPCSIHALEL